MLRLRTKNNPKHKKYEGVSKQAHPHFFDFVEDRLHATLRNEKYDSDDASYEDDSDSEVHVNWQISLLGIEAGGPTLRGFLELGTGEQGIALIGVRYKF